MGCSAKGRGLACNPTAPAPASHLVSPRLPSSFPSILETGLLSFLVSLSLSVAEGIQKNEKEWKNEEFPARNNLASKSWPRLRLSQGRPLWLEPRRNSRGGGPPEEGLGMPSWGYRRAGPSCREPKGKGCPALPLVPWEPGEGCLLSAGQPVLDSEQQDTSDNLSTACQQIFPAQVTGAARPLWALRTHRLHSSSSALGPVLWAWGAPQVLTAWC